MPRSWVDREMVTRRVEQHSNTVSGRTPAARLKRTVRWRLRLVLAGAGLLVLVACGGSGVEGDTEDAEDREVRVVDLVGEEQEVPGAVEGGVGVGFDPLVTPSVSGVDLGRLREVVELLGDPAGCPPVVAVPSWDDVVEVLRLVDGCLVLEYESLEGRSVQDVAEGFGPDSGVLAVGRPLRVAIDSSHWRDPEVGSQWHLERLGAEELWAGWPQGADVLVAVIDTGVDGNHRDLDDNLIWWGDEGHRDAVGDHGTHVAGIIAAEEGNGVAGAGVAPQASVVSLRPALFGPGSDVVVGKDEVGFLSLAGAVAEARRAGARVVNMSIKVLGDDGRTADSLPWSCDEDSFLFCGDPAAWQIRTGQWEGMVFVASAGNCGPQGGHSAPAGEDPPCRDVNQVQYPAAYEGVIAVASTDDRDLWSEFSTAAAHVDIAAPGENLLSTLSRSSFGVFRWNRERTGSMSGASMAAPVVSAVIAHLIARFPDATYQEITNALYQTARHIDLFGNPLSNTRSNELGWGIVQPLDAIQHLHNSRTSPTTTPATTTTVTTTRTTPTTTTTAAPTTTTTVAPATTAVVGDRIAYVSDRDGDAEIYVQDLSTGRVEQITDNTSDDARPVWSPDGGHIAYESWERGWAIHVYDLGTGGVEQITDNASRDSGPVWSPDGGRIAYYSDRDGDQELYIHDLDTGGVEQITDNGGSHSYRPVWSPDGGRIAYVSGSSEVYVFDLGTGRVELINDPDEGWVTGQPVWSPDGGRILYQSGWEGGRVIYVYDVGTGRVGQIPNHSYYGHSWYPVWSPDGGRIAYMNLWDARSDSEGWTVSGSERYGLYVYDLGAGRVEQITDNGSHDYGPVWSPDGGRIAYVSDLDGDLEIYVYDLVTGGVEQITDNASGAVYPVWSPDVYPVWSPDGGRIAYVSDRDGDSEIYIHDLDTGRVEQITDNDGDDWGPVWSPVGGLIDDTNASASGREMGGGETDVEEVSAGRVEQLPEEPEEIGRFYAERYSATIAEPGSMFEGRISRSGEKRSYVFEVPLGGSYETITTLGSTDVWIEVYELSGTSGEYLVASDDDSGDGANALIGIRLDPGWYRIDVHGYKEETGDYTLLVGGPSDPLEGKFVSVVVSATSEAAALRAQDDLQRQYGLEFGILLSGDYLSLRPGYWVVYLGPFDTPEESQDGCWSALNKRTGNLCYGRRLSQNPADVEVVYPPARR